MPSVCDGCPLLSAVREEVRRVLGEVQRPEATGPLLVSVAQAARLLGLGSTEVYRLLGTGAVKSVKIGRSRRIVYGSLAEWVRGLETQDG